MLPNGLDRFMMWGVYGVEVLAVAEGLATVNLLGMKMQRRVPVEDLRRVREPVPRYDFR